MNGGYTRFDEFMIGVIYLMGYTVAGAASLGALYLFVQLIKAFWEMS